jgi:hypothetical protein
MFTLSTKQKFSFLVPVFAAAALIIFSTPAAAAPSCSGNGCAALQMDAVNCIFRNISAGRIKLSIKEINDFELSMEFAPGMERKAQKAFGGCFNPAKVADYTVNYIGGPPTGADLRTGKEIAALMGFTEPHACTGSGCKDSSLIEADGCLWINYSGTTPAVAKVQIGAQSVTLNLRAAIYQATSSSASSGMPSRKCAEAWKYERSLALVKKQGFSLVTPLGHAETLIECGPEGGNPPAQSAPADGSGKYVKKYDAMTGKDYSHYQVKIAGPSGCAKNLSEIGSYSVDSK